MGSGHGFTFAAGFAAARKSRINEPMSHSFDPRISARITSDWRRVRPRIEPISPNSASYQVRSSRVPLSGYCQAVGESRSIV